jgi:type II secretory pathway component PulC
VISVAAALANLTWRLAGDAEGPSAINAAMEAFVPPAPAPDISGMINLPPFGRVMAGTAMVSAPAGLTLHGVLMTNPPTQSSAIIASGGREANSYRLGDAVGAGMILDAISVDYVVLRLGAQYFMLYFPGDERAKQAVAVPPGMASQPGAAPSGQGSVDVRTLLPSSLRLPAAPTAPGAATQQPQQPQSQQPVQQPQPQQAPPS